MLAARDAHSTALSDPSDRGACSAPIEAVERQWGGTGQWRHLAPYPVRRDASPTDSVGVWLERWRMHDGRVELRRVSASETAVAAAVAPHCTLRMTVYRRSFDAAAMAGAFTDDALRTLLRSEPRGLIYVWSPGMPLSLRGLAQAEAAARHLGVAFTAVLADAQPGEADSLRVDTAYKQTLESVELVYRDATIHYPAVLFYQDGVVLGGAVPGYKHQRTYEALAKERFAMGPKSGAARSLTAGVDGGTPDIWLDRTARVSVLATVPTRRRVGFFFKPAGATSLVAYASGNASFLFNLVTQHEQRIPGTIDPVPTPDGRFLTRPGLIFHSLPALTSGDTTPMFVDPELPDEYQTTSVLGATDARVHYRTITGWHMGVRLRHYDVALAPSGRALSIAPVGPARVPCADRALSLPISAKAGLEIGAYDTRAETSHILNVSDDGHCVSAMDLGFAAGKLAFSYDASAVAFATTRINVDAEGSLLKPSETFYRDAFVLYRTTGRLVSLSGNRMLRSMSFPEFLPDGRLIVLDQPSRARPVASFRIMEVR